MPASARKPAPIGSPRYSTSPDVGCVTPSMISTVVVLPAPFGPSRPKHWPSAIEKETPSTARTPGYCFTSSRTSSTGGIAVGMLYDCARDAEPVSAPAGAARSRIHDAAEPGADGLDA